MQKKLIHKTNYSVKNKIQSCATCFLAKWETSLVQRAFRTKCNQEYLVLF